MTPLDSLREMFAALHEATPALLPAEVEVRLPAACVRAMAESIDAQPFTTRREVVTAVERLGTTPGDVGWLRIYEPWGCIYIRTLEGR